MKTKNIAMILALALLLSCCTLRAAAEPADATPAPAAESAEDTSPQVFQDGYVRRSPVQAYQTAADYHRRRIRKGIMAAVILVILVLLVLALIRSGFLAFRFR